MGAGSRIYPWKKPSPQLGPGVAGVLDVGEAWWAQGEQSWLWNARQTGEWFEADTMLVCKSIWSWSTRQGIGQARHERTPAVPLILEQMQCVLEAGGAPSDWLPAKSAWLWSGF